MPEERQEMDTEDTERVKRLLRELKISLHHLTPTNTLLAYNAILLKDVRYGISELLIYKQQEVHQ